MDAPTQATQGGVPSLDLAIVLRTEEEACTVFWHETPTVVPYAAPFPRPRTGRVAPGHLAAIATLGDGRYFVIWRWFDAVVLGAVDGQLRLWEPVHGEVVARQRAGHPMPQPGSRAYASAGLPGAEWWLAGPAVASAQAAEVDLHEVARFFTENGLWSNL